MQNRKSVELGASSVSVIEVMSKPCIWFGLSENSPAHLIIEIVMYVSKEFKQYDL